MTVVTGASDGLGFATTKALATAGATVIMACRNADKAERARRQLGPDIETHTVIELLDLSERSSVKAFAERVKDRYEKIDLLINNAGVMAPPGQLTGDGVELQWATNYLGHFALTALLSDHVRRAKRSRIVAVSSLAAAGGNLAGYDPTTLRDYGRIRAYANSKRANLVFAIELSRRLEAVGSSTISVATHPGITHTNLSSSVSRFPLVGKAMLAASRLTTQSVEAGVGPILRAATGPDVEGGQYWGPSGRRQRRGPATLVEPPAGVNDRGEAVRLWRQSEELSGLRFEL